MKKRFSLSRMLHNDKLMLLFSLLLAVLVWALVVYGPSNTEEQVISGVPISVTLNDYATQTLNLRITEGAEATATVKVQGLRSVVSRLSASDIQVTADTGNVIKEGTYTLPLKVVSKGDYTIQNLVGPDGSNDSVTISCDVWREALYAVTVEMPNLSVTDDKKYQIGTPVVSNAVAEDGMITVSGPRSEINRVHTVAAVIDAEAAIDESSVYTARLEARDMDGKVVEGISFVNAQDSKVSVTVPVLVYREVTLNPTAVNVPSGYSSASLVTVSPKKLELWGVPSEIDDYIATVQEQLVVNFETLMPDGLKREITLEAREGIRPVNGDETLTLTVHAYNIISRVFELSLSADNFVAKNIPAGMLVSPKQTKLSVTLCGPSSVINSLTAEDLRVEADLSQAVSGMQTVKARVYAVDKNTVWACYADGAAGVDMLVSLDK